MNNENQNPNIVVQRNSYPDDKQIKTKASLTSSSFLMMPQKVRTL